MNNHKVLNLTLAFVFAFSFLGMPAPVLAQDYSATITACPICHWIQVSSDAPVGTEFMLMIDDPNNGIGTDYTRTTILEFDPNYPGNIALFNIPDIILRPGFIVTVAAESMSKTMTISPLKITGFDFVADTISGIATPGIQVHLCVNVIDHSDIGGCVWRYPVADLVTGAWTADYSVPGAPPDDITVDLVANSSHGVLYEMDANRNNTWADWPPNLYYFNVRANYDQIEAYQWDMGNMLTLKIDNPATTDNPDYTATQTVTSTAPWDPSQTYLPFYLWGIYDIQPEDIVSVSNGPLTKTTVVSNLAFTTIDIDADIVVGTAGPNQTINVWVCRQNTCVNRDETADQEGHWAANFSIPGEQNWEQDTIAIQPGDWVDSAQYDSGGNTTQYGRIAGSSISGTVYAVDNAPGHEAGGVMIEACTMDFGFCRTTVTNESGQYQLVGLAAGSYNIRAIPPGLNLPGRIGPIDISYDEIVSGQEIILPAPPPPLPPDPVEPAHPGTSTISVYWQDNLTLTAHGCGNGTATFEFTVLDDGYTVNGSMTETSADSGVYEAAMLSLYPHHGAAQIEYKITCPDGTPTVIPFFIYIDPSGLVKTTSGNPISGATITLLVADNPDGPFTAVTEGSTRMSPSNRKNPDTTNANGEFGWDVVSGFYKVRAEKAGCFSPTDPTQTFVESGVLPIPPPVTDLELILNCPLPPSASAGGPYTVDWGAMLTLDGSSSTAPDNNIASYEWDLDNDGQYDDASGVTITTSFNQIGVHAIGLRVTDDGGLSDTDITTVTVLPYTLKGFYQPIDMNGVYNITKNGSAVPFKFEIFAGSTELTDVAYIKSLTYAQTSCDVVVITDEIETTATGNTSLRYTGGQFIYNWKTPKTAGTCYRVAMTSVDGSTLMAYFKLK